MTTAHAHNWRVRALAAVALPGIFFFHLSRLIAFFGGWDQVLSPEPLIYHDHAWHYYYSIIGSRFLAATGATSGYDPYLLAGYPTDVFDTSDRLLKVLMALLPLSDAVDYKLAVLFSAAVLPLVFFAAARTWGLPRLDAIGVTLLSTWIWWEPVGRNFFETGMTGFMLASAFAFLVSGLLAAFLRRPTALRWAGLSAGLALGIIIHPGIAPIIAPPALVLLLLRLRELKPKIILALVAAGAVAAAANLFWILPYVINLQFTRSSATHFQSPVIFLYMALLPLRYGHLSFYWIPIGAALGLREWRRTGRRELWLPFALALLVLGLVTLVGGQLPLVRNSQPVRYGLPLFLAACIPAAAWLAEMVRRALALRGRRRWAPALVLLALLVSVVISFIEPARDPAAAPFVGVNPEVAAVRDWIIRSTDQSARVLVEDRGPYTPVFGQIYPLTYLAMATDREILGGPHFAAYLLQHYADLSGITLFGREIKSWQGPELAEEMARFNIGWIVARTPLTVELFNRFPDLFVPLGRAGSFSCWRFVGARGFVLQGKGRVRAEYNRLRVSGASTHLGKVVLSYHWHPCLRVDPPRRLFRAQLGSDPAGFVGVEGEGGDYDIQLRYPFFNSAKR